MKIAVIASNGRVGQLLVKEAIEHGHEVTGFAKGVNKSLAKNFVSKDVLTLTKEDLSSFDIVIDAAGGWTPETIPNIPNVAKHLISILSGTKIRLYVVGGAGSLFVNKEHTITVDMGENFPDAFKPLSFNHGIALQALRDSKDLDWVYVSPAGDFQAEGARTGEYTLAGEELTLNSKGESVISYADYVLAMIDLIESGKHLRERVSLVSK